MFNLLGIPGTMIGTAVEEECQHIWRVSDHIWHQAKNTMFLQFMLQRKSLNKHMDYENDIHMSFKKAYVCAEYFCLLPIESKFYKLTLAEK